MFSEIIPTLLTIEIFITLFLLPIIVPVVLIVMFVACCLHLPMRTLFELFHTTRKFANKFRIIIKRDQSNFTPPLGGFQVIEDSSNSSHDWSIRQVEHLDLGKNVFTDE